MDYKNFKFDQSGYERPTCKHECGRKKFWQKACWQGPDHKGKCGGTSECSPTKYDDRFECSRPERAGGACKQGPLPDGSCCNTRTKCKPSLSLRYWRRRFSYLVAVFILVLLVAFTFTDGPIFSDDNSVVGMMLSPGELSRQHSTFSEGNVCGNCHETHKDSFSHWLGSSLVKKDLSGSCTNCHLFEGQATAPHQGLYSKQGKKETKVECIACHKEHRGKDISLVNVTNTTCSNCHEKSFSNFSEDHPKFSKAYPYEKKQTVYFDHSSHIDGHFSDKSNWGKASFDTALAKKAVKKCATCHSVKGADRAVKPKNYEVVCQSCHEKQIVGNSLVVMTVDEVSPLLLGLTNDDVDSEALALQLIKSISTESMQPLMDLTKSNSALLWRGFNALESTVAAKQWMEEETHTPVMDDTEAMSGWFFGENSDGDESISYQSSGHKDPILKGWIDMYLTKAKAEPDNEKVTEALDFLLDSKGPGACGKCHTAGLKEGYWGYRNESKKESVKFNHAPHISLMGEKESCNVCHKLDKQGDFAAHFKDSDKIYESAFKGIKKAACVTCHTDEKIVSNCTSCHQYHGPSSYKKVSLMDIKNTNQHHKKKVENDK